MKTKLISTLKKDLLLVELPENKNTFDDLTFLDSETEDYTLLSTPDEIKEEDVSDFVKQSIFTSLYGHYVSGIDVNTYCYKTALESFHSALESEIYFNGNPFENPDMKKGKYIDRFGDIYLGKYEEDFKKWKEAEEKTFDKKRTLIFVKH